MLLLLINDCYMLNVLLLIMDILLFGSCVYYKVYFVVVVDL